MRSLSLALLLSAAATSLLGCDEFDVSIRTRVDASGRIEREMQIANVGKEGSSPVEKRFVLPEPARIAERSEDGKRVVIALDAPAPGTLPADFVWRAEEAVKAGRPLPRNEVEVRRVDCVLFDQYVYRETYRDSVEEADRDEAAERLFLLCRAVVLGAADIEAGERYDTRPLAAWLDGPGCRLFHDLVRIACTDKDPKRLERRIASRLGAEGIAVPLDEGEEGWSRALRRFAAATLAEHVVPTEEGARPFDAGHLLADDEESWKRLEALLSSAARAIHGSDEASNEAFGGAIHAVHGDIDGAPIDVTASIVLPGRPLRCNGLLGAPDLRETRAYWTFGAKDIARTGHVLTLETIADRPEVRGRLPRPAAALSDEDVVGVIDFLEGRSDADRAALSAAFAALGGRRTPEEVEASLPEELRNAFSWLVLVGSRGE
jgi:hypothetical protein